ncbi:MAG: hypothetical protein KF712_11175 [Akkermansiaceae bacterium]|nr:hypothetical protein [Akkermansiaceae bacterium]
MNIVFSICFLLLAISLALIAARLFRGPTAGDRVLATDLLAVCAGSAVIIHAIAGKRAVYIDVVVVLGVIIFFGTVALARTISNTPRDP